MNNNELFKIRSIFEESFMTEFLGDDGYALITRRPEEHHIQEFLSQLNDLVHGRINEFRTVMEDDDASISVVISHKDDNTELALLSTDYDGESEYIIHNKNIDLVRFVEEVVTEFKKYSTGHGLSEYQSHWREFPEEEFNSLYNWLNQYINI